MKEQTLRMLLKKLHKTEPKTGMDLLWIEPGLGTSIGVPDLFWPGQDGRWIGLELKVWKKSVQIRPSQIRYHCKSFECGYPSFLIAAFKVLEKNVINKYHIVVLSGKYIAQCKNRKIESYSYHNCFTGNLENEYIGMYDFRNMKENDFVGMKEKMMLIINS